MADVTVEDGQELTVEQQNTEQADQMDEQVEETEKQGETTSEQPNEEDGETAEANGNNPDDQAEDTPETKDTEEDPTDKEEESNEPATPSFPKTLEGFGYKFNESRQLRQIENDQPFLFKVKDSDQEYNQRHYEALGEVITEHIYQLLESEVRLTKIDIPVDVKSDEAHSFIFESANARTTDKLMLIIHGTGVVRAGQWSRRLIINDSLDSGTQLPFIKRALENSYGVVVLNTNRNSDTVNGERLPVRRISSKSQISNKFLSRSTTFEIVKDPLASRVAFNHQCINSKHKRGSESAEQHTQYVWDHVISKCAAKRIDVVAHSYGGVAVLHLVVERFDEVKNRVEKIAFTDSVHSMTSQCERQQDLTLERKQDIMQWFSEHTINWVSSDQPLDTVLSHSTDDAARLSAGTKVHEETSWYSFASIFNYFSSEEGYMQKPEEPPVAVSEDEPVTKTEDEPVTKSEEELVTKSDEEPVTKTEEPVTKSEEEPITKSDEEPVTKTEEPVTKSEEKPVTKSDEEPVTKPEEPVTKSEEPVPKGQEVGDDIDKRVESIHYESTKKSTEPHPSGETEPSSCCIII